MTFISSHLQLRGFLSKIGPHRHAREQNVLLVSNGSCFYAQDADFEAWFGPLNKGL